MTSRRLTARSVLVSTLLGVSPPELPTRSLIGTAELLGVAAGTARVALSRMVAAGEAEATDGGYRLTSPTLLARQARQSLSRSGATAAWDGTWRTAVVTGEARPAADRADLRAAMHALRYGELREGVWLRPTNLPGGALLDAERTAADQCVVLTSTVEDPVALARSLWDLDAWATRARSLVEDLERVGRPLRDGDPSALAEGFVLSASVLRHVQADPLLPRRLLPPDWPGTDLRRAYDRYDADFRSTLAAWQRAHHPRR